MVISKILFQDSVQVVLVPYNHMIQTLSSYRPNYSFHERILPGTFGRGNHFSDTHVFDLFAKLFAVNGIPISKQILWTSIIRKRFSYLLHRPFCRWMFRHIKVNNFPAIMGKHYKAKEDSKRNRGYGKEVHSCGVSHMVFDKCSPCLGGRFRRLYHIFGYRGFCYIIAE